MNKLLLKMLKPFVLETTGRRGIIKLYGEGGGLLNKGIQYEGVAEIVELERHGNMSKIHVMDISGIPDRIQSQMPIPKWVETNSVKWIEEQL